MVACSKEPVAVDIDEPEDEVPTVEATRPVREKGPLAALESGQISRELIGQCSPPVVVDLAAIARDCAAGTGECAAPPLGIAGFHEDGRVALVSAPWLDACDEGASYRLSEVTMPWLRGEDATTFTPEQRRPSGPLWRWLSTRFRRGFTTTPDIAARYCQYESWASPAHSLAFLGEPLDQWMLQVGRGRRTLPIRLIGPSNQRAFDFDALVLKPGKTCEPDDQKKEVCAREMSADLVQVALAPNRRSLLVTMLIGTPERCGTRWVVHQVLRLPDAVRKLMPKGTTPSAPEPDEEAPPATPSPE